MNYQPGLVIGSTLRQLGFFIYIMEQEEYDSLIWEIDDYPIGSSTPDEMFELVFRATTTCNECGDNIEGKASYYSRYPDMSDMSLAHIDYEPCECEEDIDETDEDDE